MNKQKRKLFIIKSNFQIAFIIGFILLLFIEAMTAGLFIYRLSADAIEDAVFSSHITINRSTQIIRPIVLKVNTYFILISIFLAGLVIVIAYLRFHALFASIIEGLENLRGNNTAFRIKLRGIKNTRELIKEFNQAASSMDNYMALLRGTIDSLLQKKELKDIERLHNKLYSLITDKD